MSTLAAVALLSGTGGARADSSIGYQIDQARDGAQTGSALTPPLRSVWTVDIPSPGDATGFSYPLIVGNSVFVTGPTDYRSVLLYSLDLATGGIQWGPVEIGGGDWSGLTYDNGLVFTVAGDGTVTAVPAVPLAPGAVGPLWTTRLDATFADADPVAANGQLYVATPGVLWALSETDGHVLWEHAITWAGQHATPSIWHNTIYLAGGSEQVYALTTSGHVLWHHGTHSTGGVGSTVAVYDGKVYVRDLARVLPPIILDAKSGAEVGTFSATAVPAFLGNTGFFLDGSTLYAQDLASGTRLWTFDAEPLSTAPVVSGHDVYIASEYGELYALDVATGHVDWQTNVGVGFVPPDEYSSVVGGFGIAEGYLVAPVGDDARMCGAPPFELVAFKMDASAPSGTVPANDDFHHATPLLGDWGCSLLGNNLGASRQPGEPDHAGAAGGASDWYSWTAPVDGDLVVEASAPFDPVLAAYTGSSLSTLVQVAANVASDRTPGSARIEIQAWKGVTYRIAVDSERDSAGDSGRGTFGLDLDFGPTSPNQFQPPENDEIYEPDPMIGAAGTVGGGNRDAGKDDGEPNHAGNRGGASVWWQWTAPISGTVTMSTACSSFNTLLAVYAGNRFALVPVAANDDAGPGVKTSLLSFDAQAGTTYLIAVDGKYNTFLERPDEGRIQLRWTTGTSTSPLLPAADPWAGGATMAPVCSGG